MYELDGNNVIAAAIAFGVAFLLGFDRLMSALGRILDRLSVGRFRAWELRRARRVVARYDQKEALAELAINADVLQAIATQGDAILALVPKIDKIYMQLHPNGGDSLDDKVTRALDYAEHAGEAIERLDKNVAELRIEVADLRSRVQMME